MGDRGETEVNGVDISQYDKSDYEDVVKNLVLNNPKAEKELRIFTHKMKEECWNNATKFIGRHPDRWRLDTVGNPVMKGLRGCMGPLCHEYDHILPFSKGGKTDVDNCQILQTQVNRQKGNKDPSHKEMRNYSLLHKFTVSEMDILETAVYGNIKREDGKIVNSGKKK